MTMTKDAFKERERALEEEFFHRVDHELLERMKAKLAKETQRHRLAAATGIHDDALLDELIDAGVSAEAVAAMTLAPLVMVAWADGKMDPKERAPILEAAADLGIAPESAAGMLLEHWLKNQPSDKLAVAWKHYVHAILARTSPMSQRAFHADLIRRVNKVAHSAKTIWSGGLTPHEKQIIEEIETTLDV